MTMGSYHEPEQMERSRPQVSRVHHQTPSILMLAVHRVLHDPHKHLDKKPSGIKSKSGDIMISRSIIHGGTFVNEHRTSRGMDILMEWVATGAFHNSDELYDGPKCHPHTRVAVLDDIMQWVNESSDSVRDEFMMWLFGPAGAGKSAIAKRIAEITAEGGLLIADFFFSRTSPTRGTKDRLIATLAYQLTVSIPDTRSYIEDAIERDPGIFHKTILNQIDTLLIKPFQSASSTQIVPSQRLIIIDGLDECNNSQAQVAILEAISHSFIQHKLPIKFLVVSRPEPDLVTSFNCNEPLRSIHRRLALDDTYRPDDDIRLFFFDKFEHIKRTHLLRSTIPKPWPTEELLDRLVGKSSGQFIYASTVVKFVESSCHRPSARLNIILGISPPGRTNPFAELDALYHHVLSSVEDLQLTLLVLSFYVMTPLFADMLYGIHMSAELFLSLEPGDIQLALINLSSIVTYHESYGSAEILHASLVDFLSDRHRSTAFYIDKESTCADFVRRIFQYVKGPDGIQAGDVVLFARVNDLYPWILKGPIRSDILNFDLDAFLHASTRRGRPISGSAIQAFWIWKRFLSDSGLDDRDKNEALDRLNESLKSRLQIYQSDLRLQLLLTLFFAHNIHYQFLSPDVPLCRRVDILLEMDDHDLHLVDQHALDFRHTSLRFRLIDMIPGYVGGDQYASAALHCMRFLCNPPKYFNNNECPAMGLIYAEWKATCEMILQMLCILLKHANASPELVQFISHHDIHQAVKIDFSGDYPSVWDVDAHILAFLNRESVIPNWRIISAIARSLIIARRQSRFDDHGGSSDGDEGWNSDGHWEWSSDEDGDEVSGEKEATRHLIRRRLDRCCSNRHRKSHLIGSDSKIL